VTNDRVSLLIVKAEFMNQGVWRVLASAGDRPAFL